MENKKVFSSLIYKFSERLSVKALGLIISIVLARLLTPNEFGQIAIITVFINLCQNFVTSGFSVALVQNKKTDDNDYSTIFYLSFGIAGILVLILLLIAPIVGNYYQNQEIVLPLKIYSLSLFVAAFNSVQHAKLQREMKFKATMITSLVSTILSGALGIVAAILGAGIWALISYYFAHTVFSAISILIVDKWYPKLVFSLQRAKELFSYGWKMLVSGLLCSLYADLRTLVIGKMYSEAQLGYYNRGQQLSDVASGTLDSAVQSVMFPVISQAQDDKLQVKQILRNTLRMGSLIIMPVMMGLTVVAEPLILVMLTEKWLPAVIFLQIICIGNITIPIMSSCLVAIKAMGRSDVYMRLEMVRRIAMIVVLLISVFVFRTIEAIAWGFVVSAWIDVLIISVPTHRLIGYGILEQAKDVWKILLSTIIMGVITYMIGLITVAPIFVLMIQVIVGAIIYAFSCIVLKETSAIQIKNKLFQMIKKR